MNIAQATLVFLINFEPESYVQHVQQSMAVYAAATLYGGFQCRYFTYKYAKILVRCTACLKGTEYCKLGDMRVSKQHNLLVSVSDCWLMLM